MVPTATLSWFHTLGAGFHQRSLSKLALTTILERANDEVEEYMVKLEETKIAFTSMQVKVNNEVEELPQHHMILKDELQHKVE